MMRNSDVKGFLAWEKLWNNKTELVNFSFAEDRYIQI